MERVERYKERVRSLKDDRHAKKALVSDQSCCDAFVFSKRTNNVGLFFTII